MREGARGGFSLIELVVGGLLATAVLLIAYTVLVTNMRAYTLIEARVQTRTAVEAGADVLFSELREVSAAGGDLVSLGADSVRIRSMRTFGVACVVAYGSTPTLTVRRTGRWFTAGDSVFVYADNSPDVATDDVWLTGSIGSLDTTATCPASGDAAQVLTLPGMASAMAIDSVRVGAPVRTFVHHWYGLHPFDGEWYLARREGGSPEPLVGPLRPRGQGGLEFEFRDATNAVTVVPTEVARIRVVLRSASAVEGPNGPVSDSSVTYIHPRN